MKYERRFVMRKFARNLFRLSMCTKIMKAD